MEKVTPEMAIDVLRTVKLRHFDEADYDAFAGIESARPLIGKTDKYLVILDDTKLTLFVEGEEDIEYAFELVAR